PGDPQREHLQSVLHSWLPMVCQRVPFRAQLLGSRNDPHCSFARAQGFAESWGAEFIDYGPSGHINAESGLGAWDEGHALLRGLCDVVKENQW
ncbi:MAG: alpha/beta hydrolase, partial [Burkholderiaceae bacterium]